MVTQITDYVARAQGRLPEQFVGKDLINALVGAFANEAQDLEDAGFPMLDLLNIDTQIGAQLDGIGDILTEPRGGKSDAAYRIALRAAGARIASSGTPEEVIEIFISLTGVLRGVDYVGAFPAGYCIGATTPIHSAVQSGAPAGQVITLVAGGMGTDDAFAGGSAVLDVEHLDVVDDLPTFSGSPTQSGYTISTDGTEVSPVYNMVDDATGTFAEIDKIAGFYNIKIALPSSRRYWKFRMRSADDAGGADPDTPSGFVIEGSNNDSDWDVLSSGLAGPGSAGTFQDYVIPAGNRADYTFYRLGGLNDATIGISEIEFFDSSLVNEVRAIASHTDDSATLVGSLTNWLSGDAIFFYGNPVVGDIVDAMVGASPVGVFVGLIDLFALPNDDLFLLPNDEFLYVPFASSGR